MSENQFITLQDVMSRIRCSKSTVYRLVRQGRFPKPAKLGLRANRWSEHEVLFWMDERVRQGGDNDQL